MNSRTDKWRPLVCGISVGHKNITAGTLGCIVEDSEGKKYILSNNHVLACENEAQIGDEILQPAPYDNGKIPDDVVAHLSNFVEIKFPFSDCKLSKFIVSFLNFIAKIFKRKTRFKIYSIDMPENEVDCAIAELITPASSEILGIGIPKGSAKVKEGEKVKKSGRTTGLTEGVVIDDDATIMVSYSQGQALFTHQIIVEGVNIAQGGDSGSAVVNEDGYVIGLLFAGSSDGKNAIVNHIDKVLNALNVQICSS